VNDEHEVDMQRTTETTALTASIKRLAITKDQKRVLLALADGGETPMPALETMLGKTGIRRVHEAVQALVDEKLITADGENMRVLPVEAWERDEHFLLGIGIQWYA
jgi:hypothetical protein